MGRSKRQKVRKGFDETASGLQWALLDRLGKVARINLHSLVTLLQILGGFLGENRVNVQVSKTLLEHLQRVVVLLGLEFSVIWQCSERVKIICIFDDDQSKS